MTTQTATQTELTAANAHRSSATNTATRANAPTKTTRRLLAGGALAGPLFLVVGFAQAFTRDGFEIGRHAFSLLSNGALGWIQITNMIVTGLLVVAGAVGLRRLLPRGRRGGSVPRLLAVYGMGLVAGGVFVADPADGFPVGGPTGTPGTVSWHGMLHLTLGGIGFLALIAACFVLARRHIARGERAWGAYSIGTGVIFFAGFAGIASGGGSVPLTVAFMAAIVVAWAWLTATCLRLARP